MKLQDLFQPRKWTGTFFPPANFDARFSGLLEYSPERGVILSYLIPEISESIFQLTELHGILDDGRCCTLIGRFSTNFSGYTHQDGQTSRRDKVSFNYLRMGGFYSASSTITEAIIALTGMQEFFFPTGFKDFVRFSATPEFQMNTPFGSLSIEHDASFRLVPEDMRSIFYCTDDEALNEIQESYARICSARPKFGLMLKTDLSYRLRIKFAEALPVNEAFTRIDSISALFSLLLYGPCHPSNIRTVSANEDGRTTVGDLYPSLGLNESTIKLCEQNLSHHNLPITIKNIDFRSVATSWFQSGAGFHTLVTMLQHETGFYTDHAVHGDLVLFSTQLESISHAAREIGKKYSYAIDKHSAHELKERIKRLLQAKTHEEAGEIISALRNEIAHVGRPRSVLNKLSAQDVFLISQCLKLVVIGYVLDSLGVSVNVRDRYQTLYMPRS